MTFEQANLDHAVYYRQRFLSVGDHQTADILSTGIPDEDSTCSHTVTDGFSTGRSGRLTFMPSKG